MKNGGKLERAEITAESMADTLRAVRALPLAFWREQLGHEPQPGEIEREIQNCLTLAMGDSVWKNAVYQVVVRRADAENSLTHLSIKRLDRQAIHDWRDLQAIKNELCGPECEAVELYPAESRCVDSANQYHLWVLPKPHARFPFGFPTRLVSEETLGRSVNRPF